MLSVGLTGNVASGKSTVARIWARAGVPVVSADALARQVVAPGSPGLEEVGRAFGEDVLAPDGTLDRARMRDRVFRDPRARRRLEAIVHPRVAALRGAWLQEQVRQGAALAVSEIPLLFEVGLEDTVDLTVFVDAPEEVRLQRLVEGRGLEQDEARRIMAAQMDPAVKRRKADHVLTNDGTRHELELRAGALLDRLRARAASEREEPRA